MSHSKKENVLLADVYSGNSLQEAEKEIRQGMLTQLFVLATKEPITLLPGKNMVHFPRSEI